MALVREITLTLNDIALIENHSTEIILKFRKKTVVKGVRMIFKFALQKAKLQAWYGLTSNLAASRPMLLGADGDSGQDTGYQDVNLYSTDVSSEVNGTQTISVYFNNKPFVEDMTITVTMIIQKTTIREWYDEYIGGGTVYQLDIRPISIPDFGSGAGSVTLTVEANTPWALSTNSTWILGITPDSGSGDASVTVVVDANSTTSPRTAYITLRPTTVQIENKTVVLTQAGNSTPSSTLTVSPTSISESSGSSDTTVTVTSNTTWTFSYPETTWCTVTLSASNKILVSLTANTDSEQRSTNITVKTTDNAVTRTIPVTQSGTGGGGSLTISPESLTFYAPASEHNVTITTEGSWTVGIPASASWLSVNYESGTGNKTIEVSAIPNSTYDNRQADITIAVGSESKTLHVLQYKNIVWNVSSDTVSIGSGGGTTTFDVQSHSGSNSYKYSVFLPDSPSWLSINPSGTEVRGDLTITVTAEPNTDTEPRSAIVRLWNQIGYPQTLEVNVTQAALGGSSITLSPTIWNVEAGSGTTFLNSITVTAPTGWTASIPSLPGAQDDWCYCLKNSETDLRINVRTNTGAARSCEVVVTAGSDTASVTVSQAASGDLPSGQSYSVGLISDMHYCVTTNKKVTTESSGNDPGDYGSNSFFREDLNKLITDFKDAGVEFVASCGDIVTSDVNDLIEFTHDYIKDWTGIDTYSGTSFWSNENYKPFYCAMGNHDHWAVYSDADHCKYINYGNNIDHNGARWGVINYNGISYNCPEQLASLSSDITYATGSLSYYVVPSGHPNDMFIFLSAYYGSRLPSASNPNYGDRNDMSQMHPHNQLDPTDLDVIDMMSYCGKTTIFTSGNETNMNFQYYKPSDLMWLKNTILTNSSKRIFVFSHYFFPQKAGGGNKYEVGSTELNGLTFHFLNKLNNDFPRTIWFSGHSHFSWKDLTYNNSGDIHYCNKDYQYIEPDATDNSQILTNYNGSNFYAAPSGKKLYNRADSQTVTDNATGWNVHLPSMSRPKESSSVMANCEAAIMTVYDDKVEISKIGYSTSDGNNYTSYTSSIYYRTLTVQNSDGSGTISGPTPGGDTPESGILTDTCMETHISLDATKYGKYNSHIRFEFEDGGYLHMYCGGAAEKGDATYGGRYSLKYNVSLSNYGWSNLLIFVGDTIPAKFRYLCYDWGIALPDPTDSTAWIYKSEFFSEGSKTKRAYFGNSTGDPVDSTNFSQAYWLAGSDKTEFINSMKSVLSNYQGKKLKSSVLIYYYDSNYVEQSILGTLQDVCYYNNDTETEYESIGLYFVNGLGGSSSKQTVRYKITF